MDLTEEVEVGLLAAFTEMLEPCLRAVKLVEATDAVDFMDVEDAALFAPVAETVDAADLMEVSEVAFLAPPTEVVDFCSEAIDWMDVALSVPVTEVVESYSVEAQDGSTLEMPC